MKSVYIVLSQTGTLFSKTIKLYTGAPYNHASIAFDANLDEMYSFGRKKRYNVLNNGFIKENFDTGIFPYFPKARCCIFEVPVTNEEYIAMHDVAKYFLQHQQIYRFNLLGVLGNVAGVKIARANRYFCSQFVSYVLNKADFWNMAPELTKPMDFFVITNKKLMFEGVIKEFAKRVPLQTINEA